MKWTLGKKLNLLLFGLILATSGLLAWVLLDFYKNEKASSIMEREVSNARQAATHIRSLWTLASDIELLKVEGSREIIFVAEDPCRSGVSKRRIAVSRYYSSQFQELEVSPEHWIQSLDVNQACLKLQPGSFKGIQILPVTVQIMTPYLLALIPAQTGARLVMISMDGFSNSSSTTSFLADSQGMILWAADGMPFLKHAIEDVGSTENALRASLKDAMGAKSFSARELGLEGLVAVWPISDEHFLASLSYRPAKMEAVSFISRQILLLAVGFLALALFIGKQLTARLTEPILDLERSAEAIGQGQFNTRFEVTGTDELDSLKRAFNRMSEQIAKLLSETQERARLESELSLAQKVQNLLIPPAQVRLNGHEIFSLMKSASHVGGDWWGFIEIPQADGPPNLMVLIGDATDHGASAALMTAAIRGAHSVLLDWSSRDPAIANDLSKVLKILNQTIHDCAKGTILMSMFVALLRPGSRELVCLNAGHPRAILLTPSGDGEGGPKVASVGTAGELLGISPEAEFTKVDRYPWLPGSQLFLYTDGLIENMDGETNVFSRKHLRRVFDSTGQQKGRALLSKVIQLWRAKAKGLHQADDVTAVLCLATDPSQADLAETGGNDAR